MTIDESIRELEKARDSIEPYLFIDEAMDQSMKTAIEIMRKYQQIEEMVKQYKKFGNIDFSMQIISGVIENGNDA